MTRFEIYPDDLVNWSGGWKQVKEGDTVVFKPGRHRFVVPEKKCLALLPSGVYVTAEPGSVIEVSGGGTLFCAVNARDVRLESIRAEYVAPGLPGNYAQFLDVRGCLGVDVRGCDVRRFNTAIKSGRSAGTGAKGQLFDGLGEGFGPTRFLHVQGCNFFDCALSAIGFKSGGTQNAIIADNTIIGYGGYGANIEGEAKPQGITSDVLFCDNRIMGGDTRLRGDTTGPIFGAYLGEHCRKVQVFGNFFGSIGGKSATTIAGVGVSTSPSQGDTPVSDIAICQNDFSGFDRPTERRRVAPIALMPGNASIRRVRIVDNKPASDVIIFRPDPSKSSGRVEFLDCPGPYMVRVSDDAM